MRVAVPTQLSIAWLPSRLPGLGTVMVSFCKATLELRPGTCALMAPPMPPTGDLAADGLVYPSDFAPFKPRADVIVRAAAHAPKGEPVRYLQVAMRIGGLKKELVVAGDRRWQRGLLGQSPGEPEPFTQMPITWARAFGGGKDAANPIGRGREGDPMPNIELPGRLIRSPGDRIAPAGFGPIPAEWEPRRSKVGTYRGDYVKQHWPWLPPDFDYAYFNAAPVDQQLDGWLRGDEELAFTNLHAQHAELTTRLPGLRSRLFVTMADGEFREVVQRLDTLFCDLEQDRVILVWRGHTPVRNPMLREVHHVLAALEPLGDAKSPEHYAAMRDPKPAAVPAPAPAAADDGHEAELAAKEAAMEAEFARAEQQLEAAAQQQQELLAAQQIDPAKLHAAAPVIGLAALGDPGILPPIAPEFLAEQPAAAEPPLTAEEAAEVAELEAEFEREKVPAPAAPSWTRERVLAAIAGGEALVGEDLSGLDLSGCALRGAPLARTVLVGCDFTGADLREAVLDGADLTGAILAGAQFTGASLAGAVLEGLKLAGLDLSACRGEGVHFAGADLSGCKLVGAVFAKGDFTGCKLAGADCRRAVLAHARLHAALASQAVFADADLTGMRADDGAVFADADFRRARADGVVLEEANLHGADLRYATMRRALLTGADLGQCDLSRADLERTSLADANLVGARLLQTNLRYGSLERCDCKGADLRGANLYGAGLWEARLELADLREANVASTLLAL
ncbi:MAG: DUF2169 domain-containing protein [Planctomycetota bacterium]